MIDLTGKTVLVTGGSRGIGASMVEHLTGAGAHVLLHYANSREKALALAAKVAASGRGRATLIAADLADPAAAGHLWQAAEQADERIDTLVNNAAVATTVAIEEPLDAWHRTWDRVLQVNLQAAADLARLAILHFRRHGGGRIINVASRAAHRGETATGWAYAASKAGLIALTKTIARQYANENVLAFSIAPGFTETDMAYEGQTEADLKRILGEIPLGSMASPQEIGALTAFLVSDHVRHLTGATFDINGASYVR
jgi:NAD(P)-dependent dehydrogenase (short-subunit alcohol dehydrogenase family)